MTPKEGGESIVDHGIRHPLFYFAKKMHRHECHSRIWKKKIHDLNLRQSWHAFRYTSCVAVWFWVIRQRCQKGRRIDRVSKDSPPSFFLLDHPQIKNLAALPVAILFLDLADAQMTLLPVTPIGGAGRHEGAAVDD